MKLRTKKRLLDLTSLALLAGGGGIIAHTRRLPPPDITSDGRRIAAPGKHPATVNQAIAISLNSSAWNRTLRQPLFDPPPPPKTEVVVQARPITVKLVGTVIEPDNNQAFIRQASGKVELKRLGEQVSSEKADGVIADITPTEIVIHRDDGDHRLAAEGRN
jgi:hypothetical protein